MRSKWRSKAEKSTDERNTSVGEGINDNSLQLSISDRLVYSGDVLANGLVVPTRHADQAIDADVVESLEVLLSVHLDLQVGPDVLVQGPRLLEVLARWGGSVSTVKERLRDLIVEGGQSTREGVAEFGDVADSQRQWWGGQEVVNEWCGASLSDVLHPIRTVHGSRFVERVHDSLEQLSVKDWSPKVSQKLFLKDLRNPDRELGLQGAEVERLAQDIQITRHQNCKRVKSVDRRSARDQGQRIDCLIVHLGALDVC